MKKLNLENLGVLEMNNHEMSNASGGSGGDLFWGWLIDVAWTHRDDIIGTHQAISAAYKKHPEALLK